MPVIASYGIIVIAFVGINIFSPQGGEIPGELENTCAYTETVYGARMTCTDGTVRDLLPSDYKE